MTDIKKLAEQLETECVCVQLREGWGEVWHAERAAAILAAAFKEQDAEIGELEAKLSLIKQGMVVKFGGQFYCLAACDYEGTPDSDKHNADLLAMLRELEWCGGDDCCEGCFVCGVSKHANHLPDCRLAALLKQHKEDKP